MVLYNDNDFFSCIAKGVGVLGQVFLTFQTAHIKFPAKKYELKNVHVLSIAAIFYHLLQVLHSSQKFTKKKKFAI